MQYGELRPVNRELDFINRDIRPVNRESFSSYKYQSNTYNEATGPRNDRLNSTKSSIYDTKSLKR